MNRHNGVHIRPATTADAEPSLAIYAPLILDTHVSFELSVPSAAEFASRIAGALALHRKIGFEPIGIFARAGHKFGRWHDVFWWQLRIREEPPADSQGRRA